MTKILIETFPRAGGYLAIANVEGALVESGGVGAGETPREASLAALRSFYARPATMPEETPSYAPLKTKVTTLGGIKDRLENAIEDGTNVEMVYRDIDGTVTTREIKPTMLKVRRNPVTPPYDRREYLQAIDITNHGGPRSFRLDRIQSVTS